jgi:ribonuclease HI
MAKRRRESNELVLYTDEKGVTLVEKAVYLGETTNNQAEYRALLIGLEEAVKLAPDRLTVRMDSELIVKQLNGEYRVRNPDLLPHYEHARELLKRFADFCIVHIPREENAGADRLANQAIDGR